MGRGQNADQILYGRGIVIKERPRSPRERSPRGNVLRVGEFFIDWGLLEEQRRTLLYFYPTSSSCSEIDSFLLRIDDLRRDEIDEVEVDVNALDGWREWLRSAEDEDTILEVSDAISGVNALLDAFSDQLWESAQAAPRP